jgi:signal-transduction protein with cAMP-binding, CBS, and nucleotidyltransferase domain
MLSNKVNEIMTTNLTTAPASATVFAVIERMVAEDVGRIIIVDNDLPVGIFTEKDVLKRVVGAKIQAHATGIKSVMTTPIRAVREETHIVDAFARMFRGKYRHLLVRGRRGKIIGIVSMRRILTLAVELGQGMSESRTVADIGTEGIVTVDETASVHQTVALMNERGVGAVIVSAGGKPAGIFTERDLLKRVAAKAIDPETTKITAVMTAPLVMMPCSALIGDVLAEMSRRDIRNMPVSGDRGDLLGLLAMPEILQYAKAFNIDEQVRRSWRQVAAELDSDDQYTPG